MDGIPQGGEVAFALLDGINLCLKSIQVFDCAVEQCLCSLLVGEKQLDVVAMILKRCQDSSNVVTINPKGFVDFCQITILSLKVVDNINNVRQC